MFVVRRPFKSNGICFTVGSVCEPAEVKLFRSKLGEGKIMEVTEDNYESTKLYMKEKWNVDLAPLPGTPVAAPFQEPIMKPEEPKAAAPAQPAQQVKQAQPAAQTKPAQPAVQPTAQAKPAQPAAQAKPAQPAAQAKPVVTTQTTVQK